MKRFRNDDRGATLVLIAGGLIGLIAFTGLVLDGGNAYSQRRQMQNSADASALAGANALQKYRENPTSYPATGIYTAARTAATANGAKDPGTFTCDLVRYAGGVETLTTKPCPTSSDTIAADGDVYFKVRVTVDSDNSTRFMSVVGIDGFNATGKAAATLRGGDLGTGPFMVCTNLSAPRPPGLPPLLIADLADPSRYSVNLAAIGFVYPIAGNEVPAWARCDLGNEFMGVVDNSYEPYEVPGTWIMKPGDTLGQQTSGLAGSCTIDGTKIKDIAVGCVLALPLCPEKVVGPYPGTEDKALYCAKIGRFQITQVVPNPSPSAPAKLVEARFLGFGVISSGPGNGVPGAGEAAVIKLNE